MSTIYGRSGLPDWTQGTMSVAASATAVTFVGATLTSTDPTTGAALWVAGRGDILVAPGVGAAIISSVDSANGLTLCAPWPYAAQTTAAYAIIRATLPATGSIAKAISDLQKSGQATNPWPINVVDDGTARFAMENVSGVPTLAVGPTGTATGSLKNALQMNTSTGALTAPSGMYASGDWISNRIINGDWTIWQQGTSIPIATANALYCADQWKVSNASGVTITAAKVAAPSGFSTFNAISLTATSMTATNKILLMQPFEAQAVADLSGQSITVSLDVNASTSSGTITGYVQLAFNATIDDGSYSNVTTALTFTVPTGSGRVTVTFPGTATAGINQGGRLMIGFTQNTSTGNPTVYVGAVQMEKGTLANPFSPKHLSVELNDCERYFLSSYDLNIAPGTASSTTPYATITQTSTYYASVNVAFRSRMRADPTVTLYSSNSGTAAKLFDQTAAADVAAVASYINQNGFMANANNVAIASAHACLFAWTASARLA